MYLILEMSGVFLSEPGSVKKYFMENLDQSVNQVCFKLLLSASGIARKVFF
jgi:hypothetical protein